MRQLIIILCAAFAFIFGQDAAGQYKLTGVNVLYTFVSRYETNITVSNDHGIQMPPTTIKTIPANVPFHTQAMVLSNAALSATGINLNVTLNPDGSGVVADGSYYPDVNTIEDENGNCVTIQQVL